MVSDMFSSQDSRSKTEMVSDIYLVHRILEVKLKWFQIYFVHRILATNVTLKRMKVKNDERCTFCNAHNENIPHLFWRWDIIVCTAFLVNV